MQRVIFFTFIIVLIAIEECKTTPFCTPAQLMKGKWVRAKNESSYNCSCPFSKSRYFCPGFNPKRMVEWMPSAISAKICIGKLDDMLPTKSNVLLTGNSHMRQQMESALCRYGASITSRNVTAGLLTDNTIPCRAGNLENNLKHCPYDPSVLGFGPGQEICNDDHSVITFSNGATLTYVFMNSEKNKTVGTNISEFFGTTLGDYDIIVANAGNDPGMSLAHFFDEISSHVLEGSTKVIWAPLYWVPDEYDEWVKSKTLGGKPPSDIQKLVLDKLVFYDLRKLTSGVKDYTVEKQKHIKFDSHFCMPGPVDSISEVLLQHIHYLYYNFDGSTKPDGGDFPQFNFEPVNGRQHTLVSHKVSDDFFV